MLVGKKYYLRFYIVLSKMGLIDSMKSRKKINIFKISWDFNITLSEKLNYKRFNKNFEKILFGIFPLALILQYFIMYIYRADILTNFQNFPITLNILLFWLLVVIISAREIAIEPQISQEFINDLFNSCKELLEIEEVLGSKLTFELLNEQILISDEIDIDSRYSRTKGYYSLFYNEEYNKIQNKTVLVLGAGALGCYISLSLSMYGVRKLIVADYDIIEPSNLNRQILYTESDVGKEKINVLSEKIHKYNSDVQVVPISIKVSSVEELEKIVAEYGSIDFIVKAIDTPIDIIKIVNQFAVSHKISYISGGFNGYYLIIDNIYIPTIGSCFGCRNINKDINKYTLSDKTKWPTTPEMPAILGGIMTNLIIKIFLGCYNETLIDNAYVYNMRNHALSQEKYVLENGECPICKKNNKVKDNNIRAKTFIRSVCFCLLSGGVAFYLLLGSSLL